MALSPSLIIQTPSNSAKLSWSSKKLVFHEAPVKLGGVPRQKSRHIISGVCLTEDSLWALINNNTLYYWYLFIQGYANINWLSNSLHSI